MPKQLPFAVALLVPILSMLGCSCDGPPLAYVQGVARVDGVPVSGMEIEFQPEHQAAPSYAVTNEQGEFDVKFTRHKRGAIIGKHTVTVRPQPDASDASGNPLPISRELHERSDQLPSLSYEVKSGGNQLDLNLTIRNRQLVLVAPSN